MKRRKENGEEEEENGDDQDKEMKTAAKVKATANMMMTGKYCSMAIIYSENELRGQQFVHIVLPSVQKLV